MAKGKTADQEPIETQVTMEDTPEAEPTDLITLAQITVTQLPIIEERLLAVKDAVSATVTEAKSLVATVDTVQAVKARRAELNKQKEALEAQRKAVKKQIMAPYDRFNAVYEECIAGPFREADAALKATIDGFEGELKKEALRKLETYYQELRSMDDLGWLPFEEALRRSGIKIGLADCKTKRPQKAMDSLANFTCGIALRMQQIRAMEDSAEIMVEFKKSLDVGAAVATVQERKRKVQEAAEEEERRKEEEARRAEMIAKVEAYIPTPAAPTEAPAPAERIWPEFRFTVYNCTRAQLIGIRNYLQQEGIKYGK